MSGYKPRELGSTKEIVDRLVDQAGGVKAVAFLLGRDVSTVAAYTDPAIKTHMNYDQVRRLTAAGHTLAAEDLAQLAGGYFTPLESKPADIGATSAATAEEYGELTAMLIRALLDGKIDQIEGAPIVRQIDEVIDLLRRVRTSISAFKVVA